MIKLVIKGNKNKSKKYFEKMLDGTKLKGLEKYGKRGVIALSAATPVDSGKTAESWEYTIERSNGNVSVIWTNSNVHKGVNIAMILQYGHGTGTGGYVAGKDYINPALRPLFDEMAAAAWKEVAGG